MKKVKKEGDSIKVDLRKLSVQTTFEGKPHVIDFRHQLGNSIRNNTNDIGVDDLARKIYFTDGEVDIPVDLVNFILEVVKSGYTVPVQIAMTNILKTK